MTEKDKDNKRPALRLTGEAKQVMDDFVKEATAKGPQPFRLPRKHNLDPRMQHPTTPSRETTSDE